MQSSLPRASESPAVFTLVVASTIEYQARPKLYHEKEGSTNARNDLACSGK